MAQFEPGRTPMDSVGRRTRGLQNRLWALETRECLSRASSLYVPWASITTACRTRARFAIDKCSTISSLASRAVFPTMTYASYSWRIQSEH
jgi:hypothetical protein